MTKHNNTMMFLSLQKRILTIFGMWLLPYRNTLYKIYTTCVIGIDLGFLACNFVHTILVWGDLDLMSEGSYILFTHVATCSKAVNFVLRKDIFKDLMETMDSKVFVSQIDKHDAILTRYSKRVRTIYVTMACTSVINILQWIFIPLLNKTQKLLPFCIWMPVDTQTSPGYELGYIYQVLMIVNSTQSFLAIDFTFVGVIMFTCAQLEMIIFNTQQIQNVPVYAISASDKNELFNRNNHLLRECVRHHQAINSFLKQVENMFHIPIFIQLSGYIMIICVVGYRMTIEPPNTAHFYSTVTYLIVMLIQLYLYCWCGNVLTTKVEELRDSMYSCPWYENDMKFRKTLCIVLECMRRPVIFRAGYFISLSRPTFVSILRCSYSYFAVLNQNKGIKE